MSIKEKCLIFSIGASIPFFAMKIFNKKYINDELGCYIETKKYIQYHSLINIGFVMRDILYEKICYKKSEKIVNLIQYCSVGISSGFICLSIIYIYNMKYTMKYDNIEEEHFLEDHLYYKEKTFDILYINNRLTEIIKKYNNDIICLPTDINNIINFYNRKNIEYDYKENKIIIGTKDYKIVVDNYTQHRPSYYCKELFHICVSIGNNQILFKNVDNVIDYVENNI